jgi:perosamine synthetase
MNIRLFKPSLGEEELNSIKESFDRSWIGLGPKVNEFEKAWENYLGCEMAVALNSATAALHLALKVFNFPEGKKVLVPSLTFSSTASAVLYNRLIPVFVDSDPVTLGISLEDLKKKWDKDCVAVIPVHYAGHPVPMDHLVPWARGKNIKIIEDCAHTAGSFYKGKKLGTWGDIGCFSFEEKKLMTTGDGGMMVTNDPGLFKDVKAMRWVGIDKDNWKSAKAYTDINQDAMHWFYEINVLGYKYNMNDLAASIGLVQLKKLTYFLRSRSKIIEQYINGLEGIEDIQVLLPYDPHKYSYQIFGIRTDHRNDLIIYLKSKGIATGCHYTPLSMQPLFKAYSRDCGYVEQQADRIISLPFHIDLSESEINYIIDTIKRYYDEK